LGKTLEKFANLVSAKEIIIKNVFGNQLNTHENADTNIIIT